MKPSLSVIVIGCFLLAGCQSANSLSSKLAPGLFGREKSRHTLSSNSPNSSSASAIQLSNDDFRQGEQALKKGDLKKARSHFLAVVKEQPNNAAAHHRLGYIADKMNDFTMSRIHYITAMKLEPNNPDIACDLGYSYLLQNKLQESQRYLEKALTIDPTHKSSLLNMASLLGKRGDYDGALAIFRQAGSEQEAQKNIAQLFPNGRPAGGTMVAETEQPNQATQNLQQQIKSLADKQRAEIEQRKKRMDLARKKLSKREIPAEDINDIFAKIDREFDQKQRSLQTLPDAVPDNRVTVPPQSPPAGSPAQNELIAQNPHQPNSTAGPPILPASNRNSSVPGEIPTQFTQTVPGSLEDYAVIQPEPNSNTASVPVNNPMMSGAPDPSGVQNTQLTQASSDPSLLNREPASPTFNQAPPAQPPLQTAQQIPSPLALNNQSVTPHQPMQTVGNPVSTDAASYQQAVALAIQMGMNAGPGQMFPLSMKQETANSQTPALNNSYSPAAPGGSLGFPAQPAPQAKKKHQHPFQHLPIEPPTTRPPQGPPSVATHENEPPAPPVENNPLFSTVQNPAPSVSSPPGGVSPANQTTEIRDWPYAPKNRVQQASHEHQPGMKGDIHQTKSETPWFHQQQNQARKPANGRQENRGQLPVMQPASQGSNMPSQWPYSPQTDKTTSQQNGPVIHRRAQYPVSGRNQSSNRASSLPRVVPATN